MCVEWEDNAGTQGGQKEGSNDVCEHFSSLWMDEAKLFVTWLSGRYGKKIITINAPGVRQWFRTPFII
jgi:hypothetical protein